MLVAMATAIFVIVSCTVVIVLCGMVIRSERNRVNPWE